MPAATRTDAEIEALAVDLEQFGRDGAELVRRLKGGV
jgi:hypothetical protein